MAERHAPEIALRRAASPFRRAVLVLALAAIAALVIALDAPLCPSATLLGLPCPGCGLTRASLALVRGDIATAVRLHPLAPLLAPLALSVAGLALVRFVRGDSEPGPNWLARSSPRLVTTLAGVLVVLVVGVWLARFFGAFGGPVPVHSLPGAPFAEERARATR